jgi:hypothetical protein
MDIRSLQRPLKDGYRQDPGSSRMVGMMTIYPVPAGYMPRKGVPAAIAKLAAPTQPGMIMSNEQPWVWSYLTVSELASGRSEGRAQRIIFMIRTS